MILVCGCWFVIVIVVVISLLVDFIPMKMYMTSEKLVNVLRMRTCASFHHLFELLNMYINGVFHEHLTFAMYCIALISLCVILYVLVLHTLSSRNESVLNLWCSFSLPERFVTVSLKLKHIAYVSYEKLNYKENKIN